MCSQIPDVGHRRALLLQKMFDEAVEEITNQRDEPPPVEKYCTEYDGNFNSNIKIKKDGHEEEKQKEVLLLIPIMVGSRHTKQSLTRN